MKKIIFCTSLFTAFPLFAETVLFSSDQCKKDPLGGALLVGCKDTSGIEICPDRLPSKMSDGALSSMEITSIIDYDFFCTSTRSFTPKLRFRQQDYPLSLGSHSLKVRHENGSSDCFVFKLDMYRSNSVMPNCKIVVTRSLSQPDNIFLNSVIAGWQTQKQRIQQDIINHRISSQSFQEMIVVFQIFDVIESCFNLFRKKDLKFTDYKESIKDLMQCSSEESLEDCSLLENLLTQANTLLSIEEKRAISRLNIAMLDLLEDAEICNDLSLERLLSAKQLVVLNTMIRKKEKLSENQEKYQHFKKLEEESQKELRTLWCQSKNHIDWNGETYGECK